jgi:DNA-binding protein HU-beta
MPNSPIPVSIITLKTLSEDVSDALGMSKKTGHEFAQALTFHIAAALADGCVVSIPGIGRIRPVIREARIGRNPSNGSVLRIPEKRAVKFTAAKPLGDLLNGNGGDGNDGDAA